jgi:predicted adenine nucleotide alpha hydrolase (AANH) superfamily ATPase
MYYNRHMKNYGLETDKLIRSLAPGTRPRLLLQACCGPCASYVLEYLCPHFDISLFFYNPNIQPEVEYEQRLEALNKLLSHFPQVSLLPGSYDAAAYTAATAGLEREPEGGARCTACFRLRLEKSAAAAARGGFDYYCSTLSVSPYKNAALINELGKAIGEAQGILWLPSDFKKRGGYQRSIELSKEFGLYRQDYCGCLYSKRA